MLAPVLDPFHWPAELHCSGRNDRLFRIEGRLGAEAAADEGRDHADRFKIALEQVRKRAAAKMRRLCRGPNLKHVGRRVVASEHRAAFKRHRAAAMLENILLENMRRILKGHIDVAITHWNE